MFIFIFYQNISELVTLKDYHFKTLDNQFVMIHCIYKMDVHSVQKKQEDN